MESLCAYDNIAVAVSGGPDSMALLHKVFNAMTNTKVVALTFDHKLREESADEAIAVKEWCTSNSIEHVTLIPERPISKSNTMSIARDVRYITMSKYCNSNNIRCLLTGHHLDDDIETMFMNMARICGINGISGISRISEIYGITVYRPLLRESKANLVQYCIDNEIPYIVDPSNTNHKYRRARIRDNIPSIMSLLETRPSLLAESMQNLKRAKDFMNSVLDQYEREYIIYERHGYSLLDVHDWSTLHEEVRLSLLSKVLKYATNSKHKTDVRNLLRLSADIANCSFEWTTLGHCKLRLYRNTLTTVRETTDSDDMTGYKLDSRICTPNNIIHIPKWVQKHLPTIVLEQDDWVYLPYKRKES